MEEEKQINKERIKTTHFEYSKFQILGKDTNKSKLLFPRN
jgi:hypothetical protein